MSAAPAPAGREESIDAFLGGLVTLVQPRDGHRAGLDAALLQALVPAGASGRALDFGAGVGTVAFAVAARAPGLTVTGVERDRDLVAFAERALALPQNAAFTARVRVVAADVTALPADAEFAGADWVLMNPPFDAVGSGTPSPDRGRRAAHVAPAGLPEKWIAAAAAALRDGGHLGLIHRADALASVLAALAAFGAIRVRPVHPAHDAPAKRILVTARRGRRGPLAVLPPLVLHRPGGAWTDEADAILRGAAELGP